MRILVTGAAGSLGAYVLDELAGCGHEIVAWSRTPHANRGEVAFQAIELDGGPIEAELEAASPDLVLHLGAISAADVVRLDPDRGHRVNVEATRRIADWTDRRGRRLVFTSTDLVFDGEQPWRREDDPARPILGYGRTKRDAEPFVAGAAGGLVARVSLLYGFSRSGRVAYFDRTVASLRRGEPQRFFEDEYRTPLDLGTAARALVRLAEVGATGTIHVGGRERVSRFELVRRVAGVIGIDPVLVVPNRRADAELAEPRPADVSLDTGRLDAILPGFYRPTIEEALASA